MAKWIWYRPTHAKDELRLRREGDCVDFGCVAPLKKTVFNAVCAWRADVTYSTTSGAVQRVEDCLKESSWWQRGDEIVRYEPPTLADTLEKAGYATDSIDGVPCFGRKLPNGALSLHLSGWDIQRVCQLVETYFEQHADTATEEERKVWGRPTAIDFGSFREACDRD